MEAEITERFVENVVTYCVEKKRAILIEDDVSNFKMTGLSTEDRIDFILLKHLFHSTRCVYNF